MLCLTQFLRGFSQILEVGCDLGRFENCWGTKNVSTTMIYTHVFNRGGRGAHSPADCLGIDADRTYAATKADKPAVFVEAEILLLSS